jgi:hypothetical protein
MGELIILYILIVGGVATFFILKDTASDSSDSHSIDQSSKTNNDTTNASLNSEKYKPTLKRRKMDQENYVHYLESQILHKKREIKLINEIDDEIQNEIRQFKQKKVVDSSIKKNTKYKQTINKLTKNSNPNTPKKRISKKGETPTKKTLNNISELTTNVNIKFIEDTHEYYVNGRKVISVSELINRYSSELNIYNDYANVPSHVLRKAALKGEALHKEIEDYEKTGFESGSVEFYNYKTIKQKLKFNVKHSEIMVAIKNSSGDFVAAGRLDMLVTFGSKVGIIDVKRTWKFYRDKVTAQVNLYRLGLLHTYGINASVLMCIRLRESIAENHIIKNDETNITNVVDLI